MPAITFSGIASGIDADAIIKSLIDARRLPLKPLENNVEANKKETTALEEFNTKLLTLRDKLQNFTTLNGSAVTKVAASSDAEILGASASNAAVPSTTTITIEKLARSGTVSFGDRFSSVDQPIAPSLQGTGTLTFTVGSGPGSKEVVINITNQTTLADLTQAINDQVPEVYASTINGGTTDSPGYLLSITGANSGAEKGALKVVASSNLTGTGVFDRQTSVDAADAELTLSGIGTVKRATNQISDLLPGVTLDLKQAGTTATVTVRNDSEKTATQFGEVVSLYNELVAFVRERDQIEREVVDGEPRLVYGDLAKTRVDNRALAEIREALFAARPTSSGAVQSFADTGLSTERDGSLGFDEKRFREALGQDPEGIDGLLRSFGDRTAATNGVIDQYTRFQGMIDVSTTANQSENDSINNRLERAEAAIEKQTDALRLMFANLEKTIGRLNSQSSSLQSALASLPTRSSR